eukprot:PhF_6_TR11273/c1_g1_i1/m.18197
MGNRMSTAPQFRSNVSLPHQTRTQVMNKLSAYLPLSTNTKVDQPATANKPERTARIKIRINQVSPKGPSIDVRHVFHGDPKHFPFQLRCSVARAFDVQSPLQCMITLLLKNGRKLELKSDNGLLHPDITNTMELAILPYRLEWNEVIVGGGWIKHPVLGLCSHVIARNLELFGRRMPDYATETPPRLDDAPPVLGILWREGVPFMALYEFKADIGTHAGKLPSNLSSAAVVTPRPVVSAQN